jgi:hypothetical protein
MCGEELEFRQDFEGESEGKRQLGISRRRWKWRIKIYLQCNGRE